LNGTCQLGQLLNLGYDQQVLNGQLLRDAYLFDPGNDHTADLRLQLMSSTDFGPSSVYFRSDDDQRTLMSGQGLLVGLSDSMLQGDWDKVQLHLGDKAHDILSGNKHICPRIKQLADEAEQSKEFRQFIEQAESREIQDFMQEHFGYVDEHPLDCMMPAICNDLSLPAFINDFRRNNSEGNFARVHEFDVRRNIFKLRYNDAALSKLSIGPLWYEIMEQIQAAMNSSIYSKSAKQSTKFALFSGHDGTISQLMSTLGSKVWNASDWPSYAGMMIIETHEIVGGYPNRSMFVSDFAFRLLYNGRVLTALIDGCDPHADLCDWNILKQRLRPFATRNMSCEVVDSSASQSSIYVTSVLTQNTALLAGSICLGLILGNVITLWHMGLISTKRFAPFISASSGSYSTVATSSSDSNRTNDDYPQTSEKLNRGLMIEKF